MKKSAEKSLPPMATQCALPPPNKWTALFKVRAAKIQLYSYQEDRDDALVEMTVLVLQMLEEPYGVRLEGMVRL